MCGTTSEMTSPSVRSTSRSTPWVLGCCGPMLTSISSVRTSNSMTVGSCFLPGTVAVAMGGFRIGGFGFQSSPGQYRVADCKAPRALLFAVRFAEQLAQNLQLVGPRVLPEPVRVEPKALQHLTVQDPLAGRDLAVLPLRVQAEQSDLSLFLVHDPVF